MRAPLATLLMFAHLATRILGFSSSLSRGGGGTAAAGVAASRHSLWRSHGERTARGDAFNATPRLRRRTTRNTSSSTTTSGGETVSKMVLRPDWEREGRVHGLRMPREKTAERAFEYLVDYPCKFQIKVIGINEGSFADDIAATVSAVCEVDASDVRFTVRDTTSGRYQSITVHAPVKNATMLYKCYEVIDEDPRVKFKF